MRSRWRLATSGYFWRNASSVGSLNSQPTVCFSRATPVSSSFTVSLGRSVACVNENRIVVRRGKTVRLGSGPALVVRTGATPKHAYV